MLASLALLAVPHRVVIEVGVPGVAAYGLVLSNAANLRRAFAPEPVAIEIVAHGPGLDLLLARRNPLAGRIATLRKDGMVFVACANTMRGRGVKTSDLIPGARVVPSGVAEIVRRQEAGWSYLKGAF